MIKIDFTDEGINKLYGELFSHANPNVRRKLLAIYLKSQGIENRDICRICRCSWPTMVSHLKAYRDSGLDAVTVSRHRGHPSGMNSFSQEIKDAFDAKPPATLKEAMARIQEMTGLTRSVPQVWSFLRKIGLKTRKVGGVPGKADPAQQEEFKKKNSNRGSRKPSRAGGQSIL